MADTEAENVEDIDIVMQEDTPASDSDSSTSLPKEEDEEYMDDEMEDTEMVAKAVDPAKVKPKVKEEPQPSRFETHPVTIKHEGKTYRIQLSLDAW
ncbi:hypothetical protein LTR67_011326 [Exophiala xenobiotica]